MTVYDIENKLNKLKPIYFLLKEWLIYEKYIFYHLIRI